MKTHGSPARRGGDRGSTRSDRVTGFVRIYQGLTRAVMPGYVETEIKNDQDQVVFRQELRIVPTQFGAFRAADVTIDVPVQRLDPGPYVMRVEARHGLVSEHRDARFTIVR